MTGARLARDRLIWVACLAGREPAESLTTAGREHLVTLLHRRGWSDMDIAELTRMTEYTTSRIRVRLGLAANLPQQDSRGVAQATEALRAVFERGSAA